LQVEGINRNIEMRQYKSIAFLILASLGFSSCEEVLDLLSDDARDAFVGDWNVKEDNTLKSTDYYIVSIEKSDSDSTAVFINNFYAISASASAKAIVSGNNISIPNQLMSGFTIQGYGSIAINGKTIDWSYTVNHNNGFVDQVTATYTKQ
jgi:hypothetical protein